MVNFKLKQSIFFARICGHLNCYTYAHIRSKSEDLIHHNGKTLQCQCWILLIEISSSAVSKVKQQELKLLTREQYRDFGTDTSRLAVLRTTLEWTTSPNDSLIRSQHPVFHLWNRNVAGTTSAVGIPEKSAFKVSNRLRQHSVRQTQEPVFWTRFDAESDGATD